MAATPAPVPPLSAYLAKRCPRRVQLDLVEPAVPLEPTADVQMRGVTTTPASTPFTNPGGMTP